MSDEKLFKRCRAMPKLRKCYWQQWYPNQLYGSPLVKYNVHIKLANVNEIKEKCKRIGIPNFCIMQTLAVWLKLEYIYIYIPHFLNKLHKRKTDKKGLILI